MAEWKNTDRGVWKMYVGGVLVYEIACLPDGTFDLLRRESGSFFKRIGIYPDFPTAKATAEKLEAERERERKLDEPGTFFVISVVGRTAYATLRLAEEFANRSAGDIIVTPVTI